MARTGPVSDCGDAEQPLVISARRSRRFLVRKDSSPLVRSAHEPSRTTSRGNERTTRRDAARRQHLRVLADSAAHDPGSAEFGDGLVLTQLAEPRFQPFSEEWSMLSSL